MTLRGFLERAYREYNHRDLIGSDPLHFVYLYDTPDDREVVALVASSLAFGRVEQISRSVARLLGLIGPPAATADSTPRAAQRERLDGFRHRFATADDVADLLEGVRRVRSRWGSMNRFFVKKCYTPALRAGGGMLAAASAFVEELASPRPGRNYLLPQPELGSACKRLHLFLRWMVRRDDVDPGCWRGVRASDLVIPMDTHMHRICTRLGLTLRRQADGRAAWEATQRFRDVRPDDPVRYDFALTRIGMLGRADRIPPIGRARPS